jgi:hypothetical protein
MCSRILSRLNFGPELELVHRFGLTLIAVCVLLAVVWLAQAEVPAGSKAEAEKYYRNLSTTLKYSTPDKIAETTLTDLATYLGYQTLTAGKLGTAPQ